MKKKKRSPTATLGFLFWAALAVILVAVALAVREPVVENVRKAFGLPAREVPSARAAEKPGAAAPAAVLTGDPPGNAQAAGARTPAAAPAAKPAPKPAAKPQGAGRQAAATRTARLWFVTVDPGGSIALSPVTRSVPAGDSPLRDTLAALLEGPTATEAGGGIVSMVPAGTKVRSVTVKSGTAVVDFNESFRFNSLGIEGLRAQLRQVVWVATEFPTVRRVQVLIEGGRVEYLGPEGAAVGSPLDRDSTFQ